MGEYWKLNIMEAAFTIHNLVGAPADEFPHEVSDVLQDGLIEPTVNIRILRICLINNYVATLPWIGFIINS